MEYQITGNLFTVIEKRESKLKQLGYFILASNDLSEEITIDNMLNTYKEQQSVEKGFRFLKSPDFLTNSLFLKKPERIEALLMVMTSCLMVYTRYQSRCIYQSLACRQANIFVVVTSRFNPLDRDLHARGGSPYDLLIFAS